jgi:hypothetical protein
MNIGITDRLVRLIGGLIIVIIDFIASGDLELAFVALGLWSFLTSTFGWCPFYKMLKINTCAITLIKKS